MTYVQSYTLLQYTQVLRFTGVVLRLFVAGYINPRFWFEYPVVLPFHGVWLSVLVSSGRCGRPVDWCES